MNMVHLSNTKICLLVIAFLFAIPISINSQEMKLHFFDLSKERNLDNIVVQLREDGFEEKEEKNVSNIPSVCYTYSGEEANTYRDDTLAILEAKAEDESINTNNPILALRNPNRTVSFFLYINNGLVPFIKQD